MFRSNFFVKNGRFFISAPCRSCCQKTLRPKLQPKYYVVQIKNDSLKTAPTPLNAKVEMSLIKEIPSRVTKQHWMKVYEAVCDILKVYKNQVRVKLETVGVDEKFINSKKLQGEELFKKASEKTPEKLKEMSHAGKEQWEIIKESENYAKAKKLPSTTVNLAKDLAMKIHQYWIIFENSPQKEKMVQVFTVCVSYGKKGATELYKFYKHVLNAPVPKIKH